MAANGVAHTLAGAPARCLYMDVPPPVKGGSGSNESAPKVSNASVPVTIAFLEARAAVLCCAFEGAIVGEPAATAAVARLTDAAVALGSAGVLDEASRVWAQGASATATAARLERICLAAAAGAMDIPLVSNAWAEVAYESARTAAKLEAVTESNLWSEDALVRRALAGKAALLEAGVVPPNDALRPAYEAAARAAHRAGGGSTTTNASSFVTALPTVIERNEALANAHAAGAPLLASYLTPPSTPPMRAAASPGTPSESGGMGGHDESSLARTFDALSLMLEEDAAAAIAEAAHRATLTAMEDFIRSTDGVTGANVEATAVDGNNNNNGGGGGGGGATRRMRLLRSLKVAVHGSATAVLVPGLAPALITDRIASHGAAALAALSLSLQRGALIGEGGNETVAATLARAWTPASEVVNGVGGASASPTPLIIPILSTVRSSITSLHAFAAPNNSRAHKDGSGGGGPPAPGTAASLAFLLPPTDALAAQGELLTPCEPARGAAFAEPTRLCVLLAAMPVLLPRENQLLLPDSASLPQSLSSQLDALAASRGECPPANSPLSSPGAPPPVYAHAVAILVLHAPLDIGEDEDDADFKETARDIIVSSAEASVRRAAAAAAMSPTLGHLGALLSWAARRPTEGSMRESQ